MTKPVITFFNNKGGVGKTSLVYHLAWMFAEQGARVVAADLDPQSNLTAAFLDEDELEVIWPFDGGEKTIYGAVGPLQRGVGDIGPAPLYRVSNKLDPSGEIALIPGDLRLSSFEDELSGQWPRCLSGDERAFRVVSAFSRLLQDAARQHDADFVLVDVGPNLGAINRAAMVATDFVVVPLAPDLFSLQGLRNLGPTLRKWRMEWRLRLDQAQVADLELPAGEMRPLGYVVLGHGVRLDRPVKSYQRWMEKIPGTF